ncbi:hypothetical protein [Sinisalibacter aestuarii]|uniref:HTH domain-containing protein n=1 Tax=Sinisalibacter aestuarii TaxID=2949426 RepID=A0ABQ5LWG7_9RHOB|nr:hypothetical protein [Sinisalibacter aestuarii]GKY89303.1 hypothetical protein STA1M1_31720 [Sinisalibacter aestuarii]
MRNAKLSEYRFLKILRGFAEDKTAQELAREIAISEKTIRASYRELREKLIEAALAEPQAFGRAGYYLTLRQNRGTEVRQFLHGIAKSEMFTSHVKRHAPRLSTSDDAQRLIFEVAIRTFCSVAIRDGAVVDYPPEMKRALTVLRTVEISIDSEGTSNRRGEAAEGFPALEAELRRQTDAERLISLRTQSSLHHYPRNVLYDDLRRYLLRVPL